MHQLADKGGDRVEGKGEGRAGNRGEGQVGNNETRVVKVFVDVFSKSRD